MAASHKRKVINYYPRQRRTKEVYHSPRKRALVIAVIGAGGKSTYIRKQAVKLSLEGRKVAVTTTTHIYNPCFQLGLPDTSGGDETVPVCSYLGVDYFGVPTDQKKLAPVSVPAFKIICSRYDYVFVEADGSHCMPAKIPVSGEPVLPFATDQVVVVMGKHAVGRRPGAVCQHYRKVEEGILPAEAALTEEHLREIARRCYIEPIRKTHPDIRTSFFLSDMYLAGNAYGVTDVTFVLMASGFGRRFSDNKNKLLEPLRGERLFQYSLRHMKRAADKLTADYRLRVHIKVVTRYPEIMDYAEAERAHDVHALYNSMAEEGITSSIRIGTRAAAADCSQAIIFFAADMPFLESSDIARFVWDFLSSGNTYGCMAFRDEKIVPGEFELEPGRRPIRLKRQVTVTSTVPGAFRLKHPQVRESLLSLRGDTGAMRIIKQHPWDTFYYYIEKKYVKDIDIENQI